MRFKQYRDDESHIFYQNMVDAILKKDVIDHPIQDTHTAISLVRFFPETKTGEREKLFNFFKVPLGTPFFESDFKDGVKGISGWETIRKQLNILFRKIVIEYHEQFIYDKYYDKFALPLLRFNHIDNKSKEYYFVMKKNIPINIFKIDDTSLHIRFNEYDNPSTIYPLSTYELLEFRNSFFTKKKQLFFKDLMKALIKKIQNSECDSNIEKIDIKTFFDDTHRHIELKTIQCLHEMKRVTEKQLYFRKRKQIVVKRLNRETFKYFYANFIIDNLLLKRDDLSFFEKMKKQKIVNNIFDPNILNEKFENTSNKYDKSFFSTLFSQYSKYIKCILPVQKNADDDIKYTQKLAITYPSNNGDEFALFHCDIDTFRTYARKYIKFMYDENKTKSTLKMLNPKRYATSTKNIIKDRFIDTQIIDIQSNSFLKNEKPTTFELLLLSIDKLKKIGINEKMIRSFYLKLYDIKYFLMKDRQGRLRYDSKLAHNIFEVLVLRILNMSETFIEHGFYHTKFINSVFKRFSTFNIDLQSIDNISIEVENLDVNINILTSLLKEGNLKPIKNLNELDDIYNYETYKKLKKHYDKINKYLNILYNDPAFNVASNMRSKTIIFNLLINILKQKEKIELFNSENKALPISLGNNQYRIEIQTHNNILGLIGGTVSGVCISGSGEERQGQITPNFMNLIVRNQSKIFLWGLMCRAKSSTGKDYYILNNFQGSINDKRIAPKEIMKNLNIVFQEFCEKNNIEAILFIPHTFNSIFLKGTPLKSETISDMDIYIVENIRLDFSYNEKGKIQGEFNMFKPK